MPSAPRFDSSGRRWLVGGASVLIALIGILAFALLNRSSQSSRSTRISSTATRADPTNPSTLVVVSPSSTLLPPARVAVSSTHKRIPGYTFDASNVVDRNLATSWQPARPISNDEETWLQLDFGAPVVVTSIRIGNGFQTFDKYGDEFLNNSRIRRGLVGFDDSVEQEIVFTEDARGLAQFDLSPATTRSLTLRILSTFPGAKWNDLAVSEIEVWGHGK